MGLQDVIADMIRENGPMSVATFMNLALVHPEYGYYTTRDPFGEEGDFTTAPEISQMFGELLGAWAADCWLKLGEPDRFYFVECGPGRGTLMGDALRATKAVPGFHQAMRLRLIEASLVLKSKQQEQLSDYDVVWINSFHDLEDDGAPFILLANEFLDALPVRQYVFTDKGWAERVIMTDNDEKPVFGTVPASVDSLPAVAKGEIVETSPLREMFVRDIAEALERRDGAALLIDYGADYNGTGDTLQAVKAHEYVNVLDHIGEADLTSHVDFMKLRTVAGVHRIRIDGPVSQCSFLQALGIGLRAEILCKKASRRQAEDIDSALKRLTGKDEMGELFKVMALSNGCRETPPGF